MPKALPHLPHALARRFIRARSAGAATEFALIGLSVILGLLVIINLGLLSFSLNALAHGVQVAARQAVVYAASKDAATGTFTCPTPTQVAGVFSQYAAPPLPAAGTDSTHNPYVTVTWTNNSSSTGTGVYLTLTGVYKWTPIGFKFGHGLVTLKISTVATVPGTTPVTTGSYSYTPTIDGTCQS